MTKLQFKGSFEEQGIFHLMVKFNLTMHFSHKGLPLFAIFVYTLPVPSPNTLLEEDTIKLIIGFLCGLFPLLRQTEAIKLDLYPSSQLTFICMVIGHLI